MGTAKHKATRYWSLLQDSPTIVRTLRRKYGAPRPTSPKRYEVGQVDRLVDLFHPARIEVRITGKRRETPSTSTFTLEAVGGELPPFLPGQYVNVFVEVDGVCTSRPMSISSGSHPRQLELTVKRKADGFVSHHLLDSFKVGDQLTISGAEGDFHYMPLRDGRDLLLIAGGSGITPFMGMMEQVLAGEAGVKIHLIYASLDPGEIIFRERLQKLLQRHADLSMTLTVDHPDPRWAGDRGWIDDSMIHRALGAGGFQGKTVFICGPPAMERSVRQTLSRMDVPRGCVRVEHAGPVDDPSLLERWPRELALGDELSVRVEGGRLPVSAHAGETLLNILEGAGYAVPVLCRSGTCGSCRTRVLKGASVSLEEPQLRPSDRRSGHVNACVCHPVSDMLVRIPGDASSRGRQARSGLPRAERSAPLPAPAREISAKPGRAHLKDVLAVGGLSLLMLVVYLSALLLG